MPSTKDILLVNPWIYDFTAYDFWLKPLGLLSVAGLLKKFTDFRLNWIDCLDRKHPLLPEKLKTKPDGRGPFHKEEVTKPEALRDIPRKYSRYGIPIAAFLHALEQIPPPDVILLTCTMTYWYPGAQLAVELMRKKFGRVPVVLGGIYATLVPEHARRAIGADAVVEGPGEQSLLPLIKEILGDSSCPDSCFESFKAIPQPAYELLHDKRTLPLLTSRGCPFSCSFCAGPLLYSKFEQMLPQSVVSQIESLHTQFKTRNFAFYDDALLLNKEKHILPLLKEIVQKKLSLIFHTPNGLHVREIDVELALLFKQAGFQSLFLSQESLNENVLKDSCPKVSSGDLEEALQNLERAGYGRHEINVYLLAGLPGQDFIGIKESMREVRRLGGRPRLAYFSPVPGTGDWQTLVNQGQISENADPLLHNKLAFPYLWGSIAPEEFESLRGLSIQS